MTAAFPLLLALALLVVATPAGAQQAEAGNRGALMAASDGDGGIRLIWFTPDGISPVAWRLEEETAGQPRVIEEHIEDTTAPDPVDAQPEAEALATELETFGRVLDAMQLMADWELARARGMVRELRDVPAGERRYRVVPLGSDGRALASALRSRPVDSHRADPLPAAAADLRVVAIRGGAELYWQPGDSPNPPPAIAWRIERDGIALDDSPLLLGTGWSATEPAATDEAVVLESEARYRVAALDVFGRSGPWRELAVFVEDVSARDPPAGLRVTAAREGIRLDWEEAASPHASGYVPERSLLRGGPYEALTTRGVPRTTTRFLDRDAGPGLLYHYRLRAMDPRGVLGEPTLPVSLRIEAGRPPPPGVPRAEVGISRVRLHWDPLPGVAGYYLQRRAADDGSWSILNDPITPEPRYDDDNLAPGSQLAYRVIAVGHDNRESEPGPSVSVRLADTRAPAAPAVVAASGSDGRVQLRFVPAEPAVRTTQLLVLRGADAEDPGVVIGNPLPGSAREWSDEWVLSGETYWYRLVALDAAGNRSQPGEPVMVRVGSGPIPVPAAPVASRTDVPFSGVELRFAPVPAGFSLLIQRRETGRGDWRTVAGPLTGERMIDAGAPPVALEYRLILRARDGVESRPSAATVVAPR